ncbi:MAG: hypothetical protein JNM07_05875 [Phycisphaerae bacterium]|nr:hypothetical protein [Phycisphaerae bacterium]
MNASGRDVVALVSPWLFTAVVAAGGRADVLPGSDWATTGTDCRVFAAGDVDGDGFADVVTINGNRDLCVARSVKGWKSGPWAGAAADVDPGSAAMFVLPAPGGGGGEVMVVAAGGGSVLLFSELREGKFANRKTLVAPPGVALVGRVNAAERTVFDAAGGAWKVGTDGFARAVGTGVGEENLVGRVSPPPYEPGALPLASFASHGAASGDWAWTVFEATRPHAHRVIRAAVTGSPDSNDRDLDGLSDAEESALGTDPRDRDTDGDGLLDGWEVKGLPRDVELGDRIALYRADASESERENMLSPLRQDVIVMVSPFEGVDRKAFEGEMPKIRRLFRDMNFVNRDGTRGLWVHFKMDPSDIPKAEHGKPWWDLGNARLKDAERGLIHWLQVTPWGGGQSSETGDMGGAGWGHDVFAHEFGHQLSLSHSGDSEAAWCPLYTSLMSYAFSYGFDGKHEGIHFSDGRFRETVLDERHLAERLPYPYEQLKYLANWPYRFTLKDAGDGTTLIDWNHNGAFDEGEVAADVNYGGSTYCGVRREHEAIASAPCLAYVGPTCVLLAADRTRDHLWMKSYLGDEKWSEKRPIANSGTERDPVLVGGPEFGLVLHHHLYNWRVTRFTVGEAGAVGAPVAIPNLSSFELNACRVGDRVLLVCRRDDDSLEYRWLTFAGNDFGKPTVTPAVKLESRSLVTPGLAVDPSDGRVVLVTSMHNSRGGVFAMRVTWLKVQGDRLWEQETSWTRGEGSGNGCCSRPVVAFTDSGQLNIFHHGGPDDSGQMIAYRTSRVGNRTLDEGWLTCMLYDVWTRSRVPVGFANGPQGAIYAYRWDAGGEHINWLATAHIGFGIEGVPMRDFNDGAKVSAWGIRHSILTMRHAGGD